MKLNYMKYNLDFIIVNFHGINFIVKQSYKDGYLAMNDGGSVFCFMNRPHKNYGHWLDDKDGYNTDVIGVVETSIPWRDTLIKIEDYIV